MVGTYNRTRIHTHKQTHHTSYIHKRSQWLINMQHTIQYTNNMDRHLLYIHVHEFTTHQVTNSHGAYCLCVRCASVFCLYWDCVTRCVFLFSLSLSCTRTVWLCVVSDFLNATFVVRTMLLIQWFRTGDTRCEYRVAFYSNQIQVIFVDYLNSIRFISDSEFSVNNRFILILWPKDRFILCWFKNQQRSLLSYCQIGWEKRKIFAPTSNWMPTCIYNSTTPLDTKVSTQIILATKSLQSNTTEWQLLIFHGEFSNAIYCHIVLNCFNHLNSRVEKYRPAKLDDLVSHEEIIATSKWDKWISVLCSDINQFDYILFCSIEIHRSESIAAFVVLWPAR